MKKPLLFAALLALPACRTPATSGAPESRGGEQATFTAAARAVGTDPGHVGDGTPLTPRDGDQLAAFAAGCFWGVEETFRQVPGVVATAVGYTGGTVAHPTYEMVCTHTTGHAETVLVEFDPKRVTYDQLLTIFFANHDPTQVNRQGPDFGSNYRSAIFTLSPEQDAAARAAKDRTQKELGEPVATQIATLGPFWKAEGYHQQYDERTGERSCPIPKGLPKGT